MNIDVTEQMITQLANIIKEYCKRTSCRHCKFVDGYNCKLCGNPSGWEISNE